ncbi:MAG: nucleotide exchange factor GrpE, partial [Firmicutes bacterium]|nr:nucleotide exchange factor GrpE [Bacillota bacterium]
MKDLCEEEKEKMNEEQVESTTAPEAVAEEATSPAWLALQKDNEQLLSRLQRLQADFDNYRKRVVNEKKEWTTQSVCDVVREMLPVIDSLERA